MMSGKTGRKLGAYRFVVLLAATGVIAGCSGVQKQLGLSRTAPDEFNVVLSLLHHVRREKGDNFWTPMAKAIRGVSEETTTGVHRLYQMAKEGTLKIN